MTTALFGSSGELRSYLRGWGLSVLVHGLAAAGAFGLLTDLRLVPEPEPFRWQVAFVERPSPAAQEAPAAPAAAEPPPEQVHAQPAQPQVRPAQPQVQMVQPVRRVETVQTVKPVEEVVRREMRQVQEQVRPAQPQIRQVQPIVQATATPASIQEQPAAEVREVQPVASVQPITQTPAQPVMQAMVQSVGSVPVQESRPVREQPLVRERDAEPVRQVEAAAPPVTRSEPRVVPKPEAMPAAPVVQATVQERPAPEPNAQPAPAPVERAPANQQVSQQVLQQALQQVAMAQPTAKADFGWLGEALWHRVLQLKRYPHEARMKGLEGRVVLRVVIGEDGQLRDLHVVRSSGSDLLDRDAMEVIKRACPLKLVHPLGRPQVAVQIPINYHLER